MIVFGPHFFFIFFLLGLGGLENEMRVFSVLSSIILLCSCASHNYSYNKIRKNQTFTVISDNFNDFSVVTKSASTKVEKNNNVANVTHITLDNLKKENLKVQLSHPNYDSIQIDLKRTVRPDALAKDIGLGVFTLGIPIIVDVFKHEFYRISPKTRNFNVHFEFRQSFMLDEYQKISKSNNPTDYENWLKNYPKSNIFQKVVDHKDSLELSIALSKQSESAIDEYLTSHQNSNYLKEAQSIKNEMVSAREMFESAKQKDKVEFYEAFLTKYPKSLHNKDAHRLMVNSAEKSAITSEKLEKMKDYVFNYLIPNESFFIQSEIDDKKRNISLAFDKQLLKKNVKNDPKNQYSEYSNLWKEYISYRNQIPSDYFNFSPSSYQKTISGIVFNKLKENSIKEKQKSFVAKLPIDFQNFTLKNDNENIVISCLDIILNNNENVSGLLKLYDVNYISHYDSKLTENDEVYQLNKYDYKGSEYIALQNIDFEEISFSSGRLNGAIKCYENSKLDFSCNISNGNFKELAYYQNGKLVKTYTITDDLSYEYEFENGENLTIKDFNSKIKQFKDSQKVLSNHLKNDALNEATNEISHGNDIVKDLVYYLDSNPIPGSHNQIETELNKYNDLIKLTKSKVNEFVAEQNEKKRLEYLALINSGNNNSSRNFGENVSNQGNRGPKWQCSRCYELLYTSSKNLKTCYRNCRNGTCLSHDWYEVKSQFPLTQCTECEQISYINSCRGYCGVGTCPKYEGGRLHRWEIIK